MAGFRDRPLTIDALTHAYEQSTWTLQDTVALLLERFAQTAHLNIWISPPVQDELVARVQALEARKQAGEIMPLFGIPFVVKDNIDIAGIPTTAACPAFSYTPSESAFVVDLLLKAGALLVGKTNLDQFATGLVGTRSPYGACKNPFDSRYISGGSSSGSAVAVATGLASFALGTDTAGSGRVPAAFNNIVGLKPTRGLLSTRGVVPACASLDCVSIFSLTLSDAQKVFDLLCQPDAQDSYLRTHSSGCTAANASRVGVPAPAYLKFFGNDQRRQLFDHAVEAMKKLGKQIVPIDFNVFQQTASMLYSGPWVAERQLVTEKLLESNPDALLPVIRQVLSVGQNMSASDAFRAMHTLQELRHQARKVLADVDLLMVPTAGSIYRMDEIEADPVGHNTDLGYYTNFTNLLDLSAVAVPAGFDSGGLPFGISLIAPAFAEDRLITLAREFHTHANTFVGAGKWAIANDPVRVSRKSTQIQLAVVGAHLRGQPLNHELLKLNATFVRQVKTAAEYKLFALAGTKPAKPGLIRVAEDGTAIELEIWEMSAQAFGHFVAAIPPPLGIGTVRLEDGSQVKCFLCESAALTGAEDISDFGGWRNFLARRSNMQRL